MTDTRLPWAARLCAAHALSGASDCAVCVAHLLIAEHLRTMVLLYYRSQLIPVQLNILFFLAQLGVIVTCLYAGRGTRLLR
jgi:hypothetical protein